MSRKVMFVVTTLGCLALASSVATAELVGYWPMSEGQGSVTVDASGNGHDGTLVGTPVWTEGPSGLGAAIEFGSGCTGINCGEWNPSTINNPDGTDVSFTLWLKRYEGGNDYQGIIANRNTWGSDDTTIYWALELNPDSNMQFGSRTQSTYGRGVVAADEWVFIAGTFDGATFTVYQNAGEPSSGAAQYGQDTEAPVRIGAAEQGDGNLNGVIDQVKLYDHILTMAEIEEDMEIEAIPYASGAVPPNNSTDIRLNPTLRWTAGDGAVSHSVYLGTDPNALSVLAAGLSEATVTVSTKLAVETTYYWRVDETDAQGTLYEGPVWNFTTEPYTYAVADVNVVTNTAVKEDAEPVKMIDGSGLLEDGTHSNVPTEMWQADLAEGGTVVDFTFDRVYKLDEARVWNYNHQYEVYLGFSTKNMTVEYAAEPNEWVTLGEFELAQGTGTQPIAPVSLDFGGAAVQYVRFTITSSYSNSGVGLSEVRFMYIPTFAREPKPEAGSVDVAPDADLSWRAGREAVSHQIHLGTDPNAVAAGLSLAGISTTASYNGALLGLQLDEEYYWMITEVNNSATPPMWNSEVWDFNTPTFIVVDDMESYDDESNLIFSSWVDGLDDTSNGGSQVGLDDPPYASQDVVHSGDQAMLFQFGKGSFTMSETDLTLGGMDMTVGGAKTLVVWFRGKVGNGTPQLYAKINDTTINYTGSAASLAAPVWKQWNIDLSSLGNAARNVTTLSLGITGAGKGTLYFDDIRLYKDAGEQTGNAVNPGTTGLMAYYPMSDNVSDASGKGHNGTAEVGSSFGAGPTNYGRALVLDGASGFVTLPIGSVIQATDSITVASWFRVDTSNNWARLFDFNDETTDVYMFFAPTNGSVSRFAITTGSNAGESLVSGPAITDDGLWHHMAVTIDGATAELKLYIDGENVDTATTETLPSDLGNTTGSRIGQSAWEDDPLFTGSVDEFYIFNRALSAGEVQYLVGDR